MRFIVLTCFFVLSFLIISPSETAAQKKQRIVLKKSHGEAGAAVEGSVTGTITGNADREFVFRARKDKGMDLNLDTVFGDAVSFAIIKPNGKIMVKDVADMLDEATQTGDYTVRVYLIDAKAGSKKKSSFRFSVFMYL